MSLPAKSFADRLVTWFTENGRALPWREDHDPYHVWVSEIMLQQTRIETVMDYYRRFMEAFPTVEALADAPLEQVLKLWEGLGYYSRARNLHKAAKMICELGGFPDSVEQIRKLPGIGEYTAGAIGAIAFDLPAAAVDGNVMRVISRLQLLTDNVLEEAARKKVRSMLEDLYPLCPVVKGQPVRANSAFVQGLMELGEVICLPASPRCECCPLKEDCQAFALHRQEELPVRISKTKRREEEMLVLLLEDEKGRQLMAVRPEKAVLAGLFEYPNGKDLNEIIKKYGLKAEAFNPHVLGEASHVFTHITWRMKVVGDRVPDLTKVLMERSPAQPEDPGRVMLPTAFKKLSEWLHPDA